MAKLLGVLCFALLAATAAGTQFKVGGSGTWTPLPDSNTMSYNQWAERTRFKIGDTLLFVYPAQKDSVLQVDKAAYDNCNTASYIQKYDDGNTVIKLDHSGPFFFISGIEANCIRNESMHIVVLADRSKGSNPPSSPPSPSPASATPPPAPESSSPPPPAPEASSSPPPAPESTSPPPTPVGTAEAPAPATEDSTPPPNGASMKVMGFISSIGALIGYLLVL